MAANLSQDATGDFAYAGFWWRCLAHFIDTFILQVCLVIFLAALAGMIGPLLVASGIRSTWDLASGGLGIMIVVTVYWLYYSLMETSVRRATWGKRICRLKVIGKGRERLSFERVSVRILLRLGHSFVFSVLGLGLGGVLGYFALGGGDAMASADSNWGGVCGMIIGSFYGVLLGSMIGYLPALWTSRKQTLHDLIAGTVVVRKVNETPTETAVSVPLSPEP